MSFILEEIHLTMFVTVDIKLRSILWYKKLLLIGLCMQGSQARLCEGSLALSIGSHRAC